MVDFEWFVDGEMGQFHPRPPVAEGPVISPVAAILIANRAFTDNETQTESDTPTAFQMPEQPPRRAVGGGGTSRRFVRQFRLGPDGG